MHYCIVECVVQRSDDHIHERETVPENGNVSQTCACEYLCVTVLNVMFLAVACFWPSSLCTYCYTVK